MQGYACITAQPKKLMSPGVQRSITLHCGSNGVLWRDEPSLASLGGLLHHREQEGDSQDFGGPAEPSMIQKKKCKHRRWTFSPVQPARQVQRENKERAGDEDALTGLSARFFHDTLSLLCLSSCSILLKCLPGGSERPLDARQVARHPIDQSKQRPHAKRINSDNTSPISSRMVSNWR